ncbi:tetratricopeptide repeat protein [Treponema sp.]
MMLRNRLFFCLPLLALLFVGFPLSAQDKPDALKTYRLGRDMEAQGRSADANIRYDEAVAICKEEISQNATNMDSYTVLAWSLLRQKKYRDAVDWGQKGLKINANDYRVIEALGEAYFYLDDYKESMKAMQKYVDGAPQGERVSVAYFFMGEIFRIQKQSQHADIAYTTAVKLEPSMSLWWYRLGMVRDSLGDAPNAVKAYEQAVRYNPNYRDASEALERAKKRL